MAPPTAPRSEPIKVVFIDVPAGITLADSILPKATSFEDITDLLCKLSGLVIDELESFAQIRLPGHGFTLNDGCWWYRIVTPTKGRNGDFITIGAEKGPWNVLDNALVWDYLLSHMTLGLSTQAAWIEFQHNLQKLRDQIEATSNLLAEVICQPEYFRDGGPGPAVETPYAGPVIVNSGEIPPTLPSDLEKFPDIEMPDFTHPFAHNQFEMSQQSFSQQLHSPPLNLMQAPTQPAYQQPRFQNTQRNTYQQPPANSNQVPQSQHDFQNGQNHAPCNRGNGRGRGRGGRDNPSFRQRPAPFSYQVGTPAVDNYAKWNAKHSKEQKEEDEQFTLQDEESCQLSFQTGSPNSGGRARPRTSGRKETEAQRQTQDAHARSAASNSNETHASNQGPFEYKKNGIRSGMRDLGRKAADASYHDFLNEDLQQHPSTANPIGGYQGSNFFGYRTEHEFKAAIPKVTSDPLGEELSNSGAWKTFPSFPAIAFSTLPGGHPFQLGEDRSILPDGVLYHPSIAGDTFSLFPDYGITTFNNGQPIDANIDINTDIMKESEINALSDSRTARSTNPNSRVSSRASNRPFSHNQNVPFTQHFTSASMYPSQLNRFQQPFGPAGYNRPALAATYETADYFNHQLTGKLKPAEYQQVRLDPALQENQGAPVMLATIETGAPVNNNNVKNTKKQSKTGKKKIRKQHQKLEQELEQHVNHQSSKKDNGINHPPKLPKPGPPVGEFSPPKPREMREEKAKQIFGLDSAAQANDSGLTITRSRNGSVKFSAGANCNRPSKRTLSAATFKLGFDDMEGAERDPDESLHLDSDSDISELTVLSRSPSPTPALDISSETAGGTSGCHSDRAQRAKTAMANRAREAKLQEKLKKKMETKVEKQIESRAERAMRRASERVGEVKRDEKEEEEEEEEEEERSS